MEEGGKKDAKTRMSLAEAEQTDTSWTHSLDLVDGLKQLGSFPLRDF